MSDSLPPVPPQDENRRFGREIAFGIQQTLACWATDFIDPYVSKWFQNRYGNRAHHVTAKHTWGGEIAGDSAAFFAYIGIKRFFQKPVDALISLFARVADPLLSRLGNNAIAGWATEHRVEKDSARYEKKLDEYKHFQAENMVDTAIIAGAATGLNVAAQRYVFGNKQGLGLILASKLIGAAATVSAMLGLRTALPTSMRHLDEELSDRYFSKLIRSTKRLFGVKDEAPALIASATGDAEPHQITPEKRDGLLAMTAHHAEKINVEDAQAFAASINGQKRVYQAMLAALAPEGKLVEVMTQEYAHAMCSTQPECYHENNAALRSEQLADAKMVVQADAQNKRRDIAAFLQLLDDAAFLAEVKQAAKSGQWPKQQNHRFTPQETQALSASLVAQTARGIDALDAAEQQATRHYALMQALAPGGAAQLLFAQEMKRMLPDVKPADLDGVAADYMGYYREEARRMAESFLPEAPAVQAALARAETLRGQYAGAGASYTQAI